MSGRGRVIVARRRSQDRLNRRYQPRTEGVVTKRGPSATGCEREKKDAQEARAAGSAGNRWAYTVVVGQAQREWIGRWVRCALRRSARG